MDYYNVTCDAQKISRSLSVNGIDLRKEVRIVYKINSVR